MERCALQFTIRLLHDDNVNGTAPNIGGIVHSTEKVEKAGHVVLSFDRSNVKNELEKKDLGCVLVALNCLPVRLFCCLRNQVNKYLVLCVIKRDDNGDQNSTLCSVFFFVSVVVSRRCWKCPFLPMTRIAFKFSECRCVLVMTMIGCGTGAAEDIFIKPVTDFIIQNIVYIAIIELIAGLFFGRPRSTVDKVNDVDVIFNHLNLPVEEVTGTFSPEWGGQVKVTGKFYGSRIENGCGDYQVRYMAE